MAKPPFRETKLWMLILSPLLAASKKNYPKDNQCLILE